MFKYQYFMLRWMSALIQYYNRIQYQQQFKFQRTNIMHQLQIINHTPHNPQQLRKKIQNYSFSLTDRIGKGYTSIVYKGRNDLTSQTVAIKVIDLKSINDEIKKNLLQIELQCMKKNLHNNILRYIDSYETVNNCYIVTEYCQGGDLQKYLRNKGRMGEEEVKGFWRQFYPAFYSLINAGYIHRDLKPANIFIKGNQLKIADFGMVKKTSQNPRDNYNVGTPVYMPPQSLISNIYSQKSDVWSIGVILYQLTHGTFPWRGQDERQLKLNIQNTKVMYDYSLISIDLGTFINRCLEKNPNFRIGVSEMMGNYWVSMTMMGANNGVGLFSDPRSAKGQFVNYGANEKMQKNISPMRSYTAPKSVSLNHIPSITMLPLQSVPSLQLIQHSDSHPLQPPKSQRPTMDSLPSCQQSNPHKRKSSFLDQNRPIFPIQQSTPTPLQPTQRNPSQQLVRHTKKSPLDYLITILNYLRYVYKVYKNVCECKAAFGNLGACYYGGKQKVKEILIRELIFGIQLQERMSKNKQNVYSIEGWAQFINSRKWQTFVNVVEQYSTKYRKLSKLAQICQTTDKDNLSNTLHNSITTIYQQIQPQIQHNCNPKNTHIFQILQILDYLTTLYQLVKQINEKGWIIFIDEINGPYKNKNKSKEIQKIEKDKQNYDFYVNKSNGNQVGYNKNVDLNQIVQCKCVVGQENWKDVWRKLRGKVQGKF